MFKRVVYIFSTLLFFPTQTMYVIAKEEREPRKDNPILHIQSPEQKTRKQEKIQLNNLRNSQKALEQHALTSVIKGQCSVDNVLQRLMDSE